MAGTEARSAEGSGTLMEIPPKKPNITIYLTQEEFRDLLEMTSELTLYWPSSENEVSLSFLPRLTFKLREKDPYDMSDHDQLYAMEQFGNSRKLKVGTEEAPMTETELQALLSDLQVDGIETGDTDYYAESEFLVDEDHGDTYQG